MPGGCVYPIQEREDFLMEQQKTEQVVAFEGSELSHVVTDANQWLQDNSSKIKVIKRDALLITNDRYQPKLAIVYFYEKLAE